MYRFFFCCYLYCSLHSESTSNFADTANITVLKGTGNTYLETLHIYHKYGVYSLKVDKGKFAELRQ